MLKKITPFLIVALIIFSCNQKNDKPTTALDTGRAFIRATLDGDFETEQSFIYNDSMNMQNFELYKAWFSRKSDAEKQQYKSSEIIVNTDSVVNDSVEIINYSNSYTKQPNEIKLIRKNNEWKVDFKFSSGKASGN